MVVDGHTLKVHTRVSLNTVVSLENGRKCSQYAVDCSSIKSVALYIPRMNMEHWLNQWRS